MNVNLTYVKLTGDPTGDAGDQYTGLDRFGRVVDQRWRRVSGTVADLDRRIYTYDRDGNVLYAENASTQAGSAGRSDVYTYDGLNQLATYQRGTLTKDGSGKPTGVTSVLHHQEWGLDAVGNFNTQATDGTTQTRTHDKQNEILTVSGATTPTYDSNGNLTRQDTGEAQVYDAWNRLAQVKTGPSGSSIATYAYDGLGRRMTWTVSSGTRTFYYSDSWQVLEERVGTARDQYVWGQGYVDDLVLRDENADGNSGNGLEQRIYALQDNNWNVRALVGAASGSVIERYLYYPYGVVTMTDAAYATRSSSSYAWNILFQGLKWQAAVDLYPGRIRGYSPTLGRWLQDDPTGFNAGDVNLYRDEGNDPASRADPMGLEEHPGSEHKWADWLCQWYSGYSGENPRRRDLNSQRPFMINYYYDSANKNIPAKIPGQAQIPVSTQRIEGLFGLAVGGVQQYDRWGKPGKVTRSKPTDATLFRVSVAGLKGITKSIAGKSRHQINVFVDFREATRAGQDTTFGQNDPDVLAHESKGTYVMEVWMGSVNKPGVGAPGNPMFWADMFAHELGLHGVGDKSDHFTEDDRRWVDTGGFNRWGHGVFSPEASALIRENLPIRDNLTWR